ncbi:pentapeptide repeat-containing protein [Gemmata sp. G18]|uniref:Pentapeptide repeat-containing protein n=1 Tax=Gemmata palustris TaxID=2822762 RepID=A0ABS5BTL0_9BACT|nr:pentapeptide repeat-containing protein [Gemmata palustris]MBP3957038.1 pentapeptide repeat-containing protein [Gemmata palustris]
MAKQAVKKPAKKVAAKTKTTPKAKTVTTAKGASVAKPKAAPKPKPKPKVDWVATLKTGAAGVKEWNALSGDAKARVKLKGADLSNTDLTKVDFNGLNLTDVNFSNANLSKASLSYSNLAGATLTGATLDGTLLSWARVNDGTKWPAEIRMADALTWAGKGPDPRKVATAEEKALPKPADFGEFLTRLKKVTDPAKLDKATDMLKAERFRLYAKVAPDHLVGVVKSQGNADLVYSCRLASDGKYSCGTQNLNICGGLRGSPCKHLLVLIVGLSKAGELDAATAHEWTQNTRGQKPELDKEAMTATFLQYKGAEAGEIDWRPTETVPEDFYAM